MIRRVWGILCLCAAVFGGSADVKQWALLVAGSNGYDNYRHQADICHAYHVVSNHGIPDEQIVVMMYDDIAYNKENPYKGNIINQPNGTNVYPGVLKDYTKKEVTPKVFLSVLSGDEEGVKALTGRNGKVIKSGPNDHIFVYFADHGAPGLLAFPSSTLHARALNKTIYKMYENKQYGKMVFYVEACESGSMFAGLLPKNINVYATTAANPKESSYACYYDKHRDTYLGDCYSVFWLQDSDKENLQQETLQEQFRLVKNETKTSHVMEYGNLTIGQLKVADFQGEQSGNPDATYNARTAPDPLVDAMPAPQVPLFIRQQKLKNSKTFEEKKAAEENLSSLKAFYEETLKLFMDIVGQPQYLNLRAQRLPITQWECYENAINQLETSCPGLRLTQNDLALRQLYMLVNVCESGYSGEKLATVIEKHAINRPFCKASNGDSYLKGQAVLMRMLVGLSSLYVLCTAPNIALSLARFTVPEFRADGIYSNLFFATHMIGIVIVMLNSSINFFVYLTMSSRFRHELKTFFLCRISSQSTLSAPHSTHNRF